MEGTSQVKIICGKKAEFITQEKWLGSGNFGVVVQGLNTIEFILSATFSQSLLHLCCTCVALVLVS